jgi:hypothetical protein
MKTDRRLYLDESGQRIVEGPPEAAVLFKVKGAPVSQAELDRWGDKLRKFVPEAKKKQQEKPQDKSATPTQNKGPGRPKKKEHS